MLLSMADVAYLACVQRPVVTIWRRRYQSSELPFPKPIRSDPPRFAAQEVIEWLTATGRGNNPDPARNLPALELRADSKLDQARAAEISAVLTLRAAHGTRLEPGLMSLRPADILRAAGFTDTDAVLTDLPAPGVVLDLADKVEQILAQHPDPAAAHNWLNEALFRPAWPELSRAMLARELGRLIARTATELAALTSSSSILDVPGRGLGWVESLPPSWAGVVRIGGSDALSRHVRRSVMLRGLPAGSPNDERPTVKVDLVLGESPATTIARLSPDGVAATKLGVGPARDLTEPHCAAEAAREAALRSGHLRAIVKLPRGLRATHPREQLALWLIAKAPPAGSQRTFIADLSGHAFDDKLVTQLVHDLLLVATRPTDAEPEVLRGVDTAALLARRGSLAVPPPVAAVPTDCPVGTAEAVRRLADRAGMGGDLRITPETDRTRVRISVADAIERRWLTALPGIRLDADSTEGSPPDALLPVWELEGGIIVCSDRVDKTAALELPRAWLTQPGDVIHSGGGAAVVDTKGGALVLFPTRALRVAPHAPVVPHQVQRAILTAPPGSTSERWVLTLASDDGLRTISKVHSRIRRRRQDLEGELGQLARFEDALLDAYDAQLINVELD